MPANSGIVLRVGGGGGTAVVATAAAREKHRRPKQGRAGKRGAQRDARFFGDLKAHMERDRGGPPPPLPPPPLPQNKRQQRTKEGRSDSDASAVAANGGDRKRAKRPAAPAAAAGGDLGLPSRSDTATWRNLKQGFRSIGKQSLDGTWEYRHADHALVHVLTCRTWHWDDAAADLPANYKWVDRAARAAAAEAAAVAAVEAKAAAEEAAEEQAALAQADAAADEVAKQFRRLKAWLGEGAQEWHCRQTMGVYEDYKESKPQGPYTLRELSWLYHVGHPEPVRITWLFPTRTHALLLFLSIFCRSVKSKADAASSQNMLAAHWRGRPPPPELTEDTEVRCGKLDRPGQWTHLAALSSAQCQKLLRGPWRPEQQPHPLDSSDGRRVEAAWDQHAGRAGPLAGGGGGGMPAFSGRPRPMTEGLAWQDLATLDPGVRALHTSRGSVGLFVGRLNLFGPQSQSQSLAN